MAPLSLRDRDLPTVRILGIQFQWEGSDLTNSGIPIQPDITGWVPEHRSHVAYSIRSTQETIQKGNLRIKARFWSSGGKGRIQVRARSVKVDPKDLIQFEIHEKYEGKDALGSVSPTTIYFNDSNYSVFRGKYTFVPLKLEGVNFPDLGIGIYDINWKWEFRVLDDEATEEQGKSVWKEDWHFIRSSNIKLPRPLIEPFEMTKHRVYITLDQPQHPWTDGSIPDTRAGLPLDLPLSAKALELACKWANGAKTKKEAATLITNRLYNSGRFVYNPNPNYVDAKGKGEKLLQGVELEANPDSHITYFHFNKVLERLAGGYGMGENANCLDCALIVSTLTNALGCELRIGKFQNSPDIDASDEAHYMDNRFEINPVIAIGKQDTKESEAGLLYEGRPYFTYHTVAWEAPDGKDPNPEEFEDPDVTIFDACVNFLMDGERISAAGLPMGNGEAEGSYVNLLASNTEDGRPRCKPQPITVFKVQLTS